MLELLFRSRTEVKILSVVLFNDGLHLREIARRASTSSFQAKKELDNLVKLNVLKTKRKGNQLSFYLNKNCSFLGDLKNIYNKTEGVFHFLINEFKTTNGINFAFIFGSTARGVENQSSDIDLMIIGSVNELDLIKIILRVQKKTEKEINYILWSEQDLIKKVNEKNSFIKSIVKNKKIWIKGDENEFIRIVKKRSG